MSNILIGCDPEVFLIDRETRAFRSAAGMFPGTKKEPFKVNHGAIQVDGTALEFNIDPASSGEEFVHHVKSVWNQLVNMVKDVTRDQWELEITPVAIFAKKYWDGIDMSAKELGCDPDYDVTGNINENPSERLEDRPLRTGSGHIHIGFTNGKTTEDTGHFEDCRFIANSFFMRKVYAPTSRVENKRLQYYGMNGSFRPKSYGVEIRSPSNLWLRSDETIRGIYDSTVDHFQKLGA